MNLQPVPPVSETALPLSPRTVFGVIGGPLAWFAQLVTGYAMASGPCFPHDRRLASPASAMAWTHTGILLLLALCTLVAFAAFWVSRRDLGHGAQPTAAATGRSRFVATWGMLLGGGFCVATVLTAVGIGLLPRCAG